jgi:hypothetical protein
MACIMDISAYFDVLNFKAFGLELQKRKRNFYHVYVTESYSSMSHFKQRSIV